MKTDHKIHQWRKFLSNSKDKVLLIKFIAEECREELRSTQEEADTRVFLHGPHAAAAGYRAVVITSDDTYVFVLFLTFKGFISCPVFVKRSKQTRTVYMDVSRIVQMLGSELVSTPSLAATVSVRCTALRQRPIMSTCYAIGIDWLSLWLPLDYGVCNAIHLCCAKQVKVDSNHLSR